MPEKRKRGRPKRLTDAQRRSVVVSVKVRPGDALTFQDRAKALRDQVEREDDPHVERPA